MVCVGEGLDAAMVCDGKGGHPPFFCPLHDVLHLGNAVHIAHLGMTVEFHPLHRSIVLPSGGEIFAPFDSCNGPDSQLTVKAVNGGNPFYADEAPLFHGSVRIGFLVFP